MSHVSPCLVCPVVPARPRLGDRGLGIHLNARERERDKSVRVMVDLRAETSSLSNKTEFTETQGQSAPHYGSTLGTDPSGRAAQREGRAESGVRRHGCTRGSKEAPGKPGRDVHSGQAGSQRMGVDFPDSHR